MNTTLRALINQAERLVRTGVYEEGVALCHAILRRYPRYARCYRILGEAYLGLAEYEEAARLFRRALGVDPEDPVAYAGLGIIFEERGLLEEAIWQLERAFELAPGRDELRRELGRLYERRGSAAYVQLTRAALARLYARAGLWNKAIGELRDLLVREPYRLDLRATMVRTLWRARQRTEAAQQAQSILDQAPNCLVARLVLGTHWYQEGRAEEARRLLDGAQELDPENREAARLLAGESPLPLRAARVEMDTPVPNDAPDLDAEEVSLWPRAAVGPQGPGEPAEPAEPAADEHIVTVPLEAIQELLSSLAVDTAPGEPAAEAPVGVEEGGGDAGEAPAGAALPPEEQEEGPLGLEDEPALLSPVAVWRRRLEVAPEDQEAQVALARALAEAGELAEALAICDRLATPASGLLDRALAELEAMAELYPDSRPLREVMGDAYARGGRFQEAMAMYRWLLEHEDASDAAGGLDE